MKYMFRYTLNLMIVLASLSVMFVSCNAEDHSREKHSNQFITLEVKNIKRYELPIGVTTRAANPDNEAIGTLYALFFESSGDKSFLTYRKAKRTGEKTFEIPTAKIYYVDNVDIAIVTNMDESVLMGIPETSSYDNVIKKLNFDAYAHPENDGYPYWGVITNTSLKNKSEKSVALVRSLASFTIDASSAINPHPTYDRTLTEIYVTDQAKFANVGFALDGVNKPILPNPYTHEGSNRFIKCDAQISDQVSKPLPLTESIGAGSFVILKMGKSFYRFMLPKTIKRNHKYHFVIKNLVGYGYDSVEDAVKEEDNAEVEIVTWDEDIIFAATFVGEYMGIADTKFLFLPKDGIGGRGEIPRLAKIKVQTNVQIDNDPAPPIGKPRPVRLFDLVLSKPHTTEPEPDKEIPDELWLNHFEAHYEIDVPEGEDQHIVLEKLTAGHGGSGYYFSYTGKARLMLFGTFMYDLDVLYNPQR